MRPWAAGVSPVAPDDMREVAASSFPGGRWQVGLINKFLTRPPGPRRVVKDAGTRQLIFEKEGPQIPL